MSVPKCHRGRASRILLRQSGLVFAWLVVFVFLDARGFSGSKVSAQWGSPPRIPAFTNPETNETLVRKAAEVQALVEKMSNEEERGELGSRMTGLWSTLGQPGNAEACFDKFSEMPLEDKFRRLSEVTRGYANAGRWKEGWLVAEKMKALEQTNDSKYAIRRSEKYVVTEITKQVDPLQGLKWIDENVKLENERWKWSDMDARYKRELLVEVVKQLGREGRQAEAVAMIKERFSGLDTHDHLLWDLAIACRNNGFDVSLEVIDEIGDPAIARKVLYRLNLKAKSFEQWQSVVLNLKKRLGPSVAVNSTIHGKWQEAGGNRARVLGVLSELYSQLDRDAPKAVAAQKLANLYIEAGQIDKANEYVDLGALEAGSEYAKAIYRRTKYFCQVHDSLLPLHQFLKKLNPETRAWAALLYMRGDHRECPKNAIEFTPELLKHVEYLDTQWDELIRYAVKTKNPELVSNFIREFRKHNEAAGLSSSVDHYWAKVIELHFEAGDEMLALDRLQFVGGTNGHVLAATVLVRHDYFEEALHQLELHDSAIDRLDNENQGGWFSKDLARRKVFYRLLKSKHVGPAIDFANRVAKSTGLKVWDENPDTVFSMFNDRKDYDSLKSDLLLLGQLLPDSQELSQRLLDAYAGAGDFEELIEALAEFQKRWPGEAETEQLSWYFYAMLSKLAEQPGLEQKMIAHIKTLRLPKIERDKLLSEVLGFLANYWLEAHEDRRALDLLDVSENHRVKLSVLSTLTWGVRYRSRGQALNY